VPEVAEPTSFTLYAVVATLLFSLFWFGITQLYIQSQSSTS